MSVYVFRADAFIVHSGVVPVEADTYEQAKAKLQLMRHDEIYRMFDDVGTKLYQASAYDCYSDDGATDIPVFDGTPKCNIHLLDGPYGELTAWCGGLIQPDKLLRLEREIEIDPSLFGDKLIGELTKFMWDARKMLAHKDLAQKDDEG